MDHEGNQLNPPQSGTIPSNKAELVDMERGLTQIERNLTQEKQEKEQRLKVINDELDSIQTAKSAISRILNHDEQGTHPGSSTEHSTQSVSYETWDEYRKADYAIPEECFASPSELKQIIEDLPIPAGMKVNQTWPIKKERNLRALGLMAGRTPDGTFRLLDMANVMSAVGLFDGLGHRFKTTLTRHMESVPDEWENLGSGIWKFLKAPAVTAQTHTSEAAS